MSGPALPTAFDVSTMRAALPGPSVQTPHLQTPVPAAAAGWATDFMSADFGAVQQQQQPQNQAQMTGVARPVQSVIGDVHAHTPSPLMQSRGLLFVNFKAVYECNNFFYI